MNSPQSNGKPVENLFAAAEGGDIAAARAAMSAGADVNGMTDDDYAGPLTVLMKYDLASRSGLTSLMIAATAGHAKMVRYLLDNGAEPKLLQNADWSGHPTALHLAARYGQQEVVGLLLARGID